MNSWINKIAGACCLLLAAAALLSGTKAIPVPGREAPPVWTEQTVVAHAMGSIDGHFYTNSYEAFQQNYEQGTRLFEVDLQLTTDNYLISRHDWGAYLYDLFQQPLPRSEMDKPISLKQILDLPILEKYHAMSFEQISELLRQYPDAWIITDTKGTTRDEVQASFQALIHAAGSDSNVLSRVIPQLYSRDMYAWVQEVYPFSSYIYTLYQSPDTNSQILDFVRHNNRIDAIVMPEDRARKSKLLISTLALLQVPVYAHTVNDLEDTRSLLAAGVHGIYSDSLTDSQLQAAGIHSS